MAEFAAPLADGIGNLGLDMDSYVEEDWGDLEPLFFDEAVAVAEHAAAEEKRRQKEEEEAREVERRKLKFQAYMAARDRIREFDPKLNRFCFTRFYMVDLSEFDLDEESPLGPMRYTDTYTKVSSNEYGTICNHGGKKWFRPSDSANVLSVKIISSVVSFPVNVYGTVIARDSLDSKCVYLFRCDRDHCQLISTVDESLTLTGPKRGLVLQGDIYFEMDLKIKGDDQEGRGDKEFSKGFLQLDGIVRRTREEMVVESDSLDSKLSTVEVKFAVVKRAVEATVAIEVLQGEFNGNITAETTSIRDSLVLYDTQVAGAWIGVRKGTIQLLRPVIAVCADESLIMNTVEVSGSGEVKYASSVEFKAAVNGRAETEIPCGSCTLGVKIAWSIIEMNYLA